MSSFVTRSERAGNIFFRITALIRSGQLQWADRPAWYDVYVAHPPLTPHDWNVQLPKYNEPVKKIFYEEDIVRAEFYKTHRNVGHVTMETEGDSISQKFINEYQALSKEEPNLSMEEMFTQTEKRLEDIGLSLKPKPKKQSTVEPKKETTEESNPSASQ